MTDLEHLAEHHILEYESRLKHFDELMNRAKEAEAAHLGEELAEIEKERDRLVEDFKQKSAEEWAEKGGPMVMWDIVAQRLESLVERIKH